MASLVIITSKGIGLYASKIEEVYDLVKGASYTVLTCVNPNIPALPSVDYAHPSMYAIVDIGDSIIFKDNAIFSKFEDIYTVTSLGIFQVTKGGLVPIPSKKVIEDNVKYDSNIIEKMIPGFENAFNSIERVFINVKLIERINSDVLTASNAWSIICLEAALHKQELEKCTERIYQCDVKQIASDCENIKDELKKLVVKSC